MTEEQNWYLKKHEDGEVFGPVTLEKLIEWTKATQVNPQDLVSTDQHTWTRAPMVPQLSMDWLIEVGDDLYYGPTTAEAVMENAALGLIAPDTTVINCLENERFALRDAPFYVVPEKNGDTPGGHRTGAIRLNLQRRIRELEQQALTTQRKLNERKEKILRLEKKIHDLELRIHDLQAKR